MRTENMQLVPYEPGSSRRPADTDPTAAAAAAEASHGTPQPPAPGGHVAVRLWFRLASLEYSSAQRLACIQMRLLHWHGILPCLGRLHRMSNLHSTLQSIDFIASISMVCCISSSPLDGRLRDMRASLCPRRQLQAQRRSQGSRCPGWTATAPVSCLSPCGSCPSCPLAATQVLNSF